MCFLFEMQTVKTAIFLLGNLVYDLLFALLCMFLILAIILFLYVINFPYTSCKYYYNLHAKKNF